MQNRAVSASELSLPTFQVPQLIQRSTRGILGFCLLHQVKVSCTPCTLGQMPQPHSATQTCGCSSRVLGMQSALSSAFNVPHSLLQQIQARTVHLKSRSQIKYTFGYPGPVPGLAAGIQLSAKAL